MTDRELLGAAAKAAGVEIIDWYESDPTIWDGVEPCAWNPLTDDGDALRLAVALRLDVEWQYGAVFADGNFSEFDDMPDPCAATRRAIVRAAAAMHEHAIVKATK